MKNSRKGADTRAINIIIVIPLLILSILAFNKIIDYKTGGEATAKLDNAIGKTQTLAIFPEFVNSIKPSDTKEDVEKKLKDTYKKYYQTTYLIQDRCFEFTPTYINCVMAVGQKDQKDPKGGRFDEMLAYRPTPNGIQEIDIRVFRLI